MTRFETYTVGALARASGVSVRTLHHCDALGLLVPARVAGYGHRLYTRAEALRLQEILFYRAAGMPPAEIASVLDGAARVARLDAHRARPTQALGGDARMLATLDRTLADLKGETPMTLDALYTPFDAETQAGYEAWLVETYGPDMARAIAASKAHPTQAPEGMEAKVEALREIEADLVAAYEGGADPAAVDLAHLDFIARYEALSPGFSHWLPTGMKAATG